VGDRLSLQLVCPEGRPLRSQVERGAEPAKTLVPSRGGRPSDPVVRSPIVEELAIGL